MEEKKKVRLCIISRMRDDEGRMHETKTAQRGLLSKTANGMALEYDEEQDGEKAHMILFGAEGDIDYDSLTLLDDENDLEEVSEHPPCEGNVIEPPRSVSESGLRPPLQRCGDRK